MKALDKQLRPPSHSSGTTLLEVVVMVGLSSVMLGLAVMSMQLMMRSERHATESVWNNAVLGRSSEIFRRDIHAASAVRLENDQEQADPQLRLQLPDGEIVRYRIDRHELVRELQSAAGENRAAETFRFRSGSRIRLGVEPGPPRVVRLAVEQPSGHSKGKAAAEGEPRRTFVVEGVPGRDHRFSGDE